MEELAPAVLCAGEQPPHADAGAPSCPDWWCCSSREGREIQLWSPAAGGGSRSGRCPGDDVHAGRINPPHASRGALFWVLEGGWRSSKELEPIESVGQGGAPGARYIWGVIVMHFMPSHMESVPGASGHVSLWLWTRKLNRFGWSRSSEPDTKPEKMFPSPSFVLSRCHHFPSWSLGATERLSAGTLVCVGGILVFSIDLLCSHIWISALTQTLTDAEPPEQFVPHPANASLCKIMSYFLCPQPFFFLLLTVKPLRSLFNNVNSNRFHRCRN